jgi:hypothetical protein
MGLARYEQLRLGPLPQHPSVLRSGLGFKEATSMPEPRVREPARPAPPYCPRCEAASRARLGSPHLPLLRIPPPPAWRTVAWRGTPACTGQPSLRSVPGLGLRSRQQGGRVAATRQVTREALLTLYGAALMEERMLKKEERAELKDLAEKKWGK